LLIVINIYLIMLVSWKTSRSS